jgi:hypothetical protein
MKHSIEMGSDAIIFRPSSMKTDSAIQKLMRRRVTDSTVNALAYFYLFLKLSLIYGLHITISQKIRIFITTAMRTSNPAQYLLLCSRLAADYAS